MLAIAHAKTDQNILSANDKIETFVANKQFADAFTYCNVALAQNPTPQFAHFLQAAKLRLFVKTKQNIDTVPALYLHLQKYKPSSDSIDCFLSARIPEVYGHYFFIKGEPDQAVLFLKKAELRYKACDNIESRVYNLNMLGNILKRQNKYSDALLVLLRAEDIINHSPVDSDDLLNALKNDIGLVYYSLGNYPKALGYYNSLDYSLLSPLQVANAKNNLGIIYLADAKVDTAIKNFHNAAIIYDKIEKWSDLAATYNNLGSALELKYPQPDSALYYLDLAIKLSVSLKDSLNMISPLVNICTLEFRRKNYALTLKTLNDLARYNHLFRLEDKEIYHQLSALTYEKLGNTEAALANFKLYHAYADTLIRRANSTELARAENAFQIEKQEKHIALLSQQKTISENNELHTRMMSWFIGVIGFLIILSLTVLLNHFYKKQKLQQKIRRRELRLASMKSLMEGQEKERGRLAKDLHDSVGNNLALLKAEVVNNQKHTQNQYMLGLISQTAEDVRNITHNLMPPVLVNIGLQAALKDMVTLWRHSSETVIDLNISETLPLLPKETQLSVFRIIQELIKNALEHGKADYILINLCHNNEAIFLDFEDNGVGADLKKLEECSGLGLQNIKHRVTLLNGSMDIHSDGTGTKFSISFSNSQI